MRGKTKLISIIAILSIVMFVSAVFASGLVDVTEISLLSIGESDELTAGTASIYVNPPYVKDSAKQVGSFFTVYVNISGVSDLYTWQINITWTKDKIVPTRDVIQVNRLIGNEFLARSANPTSTETLGLVINSTDNTQRTSGFSETILGDVGGISGNGVLVGIEFKVIGYGSCDIIISTTGRLPTKLLDSAGGTITITTKTDGYFRNKYPGDINGDKTVGSGDFSILAGCYATSPPNPLYNREADFDLNNYVGSEDFSVLAGSYGTTYP